MKKHKDANAPFQEGDLVTTAYYDFDEHIVLGWYQTRRSWLLRAERDPLIYWRPYCSALAEIAAADETISIMTNG